ncbi:hypothetical protein AHF37_08236 [Paragonimus kellicotti]|nr:hypothetical protein AHF37_08236 [Paragonimus kellicotti]
MSETFVFNVSNATTADPWSTIKTQEYVHLSKGEVIFGAFVFSLLVVTAVLGNAVVCIILRFRYMRFTRCTSLICGYCCHKSTKPGSVGFMEPTRNEDLWADDLPSSQHECSCGKACPPPQIGQKATGSYLIFTANPVRNQFTAKKNQSSEVRLNRLGSSRLRDEMQPERRPASEQYWVGKVHVRAVPRTDFQRGTSGRNGSITSLFLFNLSLADFLMAVFCIPTYIRDRVDLRLLAFGRTIVQNDELCTRYQRVCQRSNTCAHLVGSFCVSLLSPSPTHVTPLRSRVTYGCMGPGLYHSSPDTYS